MSKTMLMKIYNEINRMVDEEGENEPDRIIVNNKAFDELANDCGRYPMILTMTSKNKYKLRDMELCVDKNQKEEFLLIYKY